jgi:hypothetical protein
MKKLKIFLLLLMIPFTVAFAQEDGSAKKKQKKAEKAKQEQIKKQRKAEELGKKRHAKIQSKEVKKRWKKNKRRYKHVDSFDKKTSLWRKIFPRRRPENK